jgi:hypothetical protein
MPDTDIESDTYIEDTNGDQNSYKKRIFKFFGIRDLCCLTFTLIMIAFVSGILVFITLLIIGVLS